MKGAGTLFPETASDDEHAPAQELEEDPGQGLDPADDEGIPIALVGAGGRPRGNRNKPKPTSTSSDSQATYQLSSGKPRKPATDQAADPAGQQVPIVSAAPGPRKRRGRSAGSKNRKPWQRCQANSCSLAEG